MNELTSGSCDLQTCSETDRLFKSTSWHHWSTCRRPSCASIGAFTFGYVAASFLWIDSRPQHVTVRPHAHFRPHLQFFLFVFFLVELFTSLKRILSVWLNSTALNIAGANWQASPVLTRRGRIVRRWPFHFYNNLNGHRIFDFLSENSSFGFIVIFVSYS